MIFGPAAPTKGSRIVLVLSVVFAMYSGIALAASAAHAVLPEGGEIPRLMYGAGEETAQTDLDSKYVGQRNRLVVFDPLVLAEIAESEEPSLASLALFDDVNISVSVERVRSDVPDAVTFSGRVLDAEHGYFLMSADGEGRILVQIDILEEALSYIVSQDPESGQYYAVEYPIEAVRGALPSMPRIPPRDKDAAPPLPVVPVMDDRVTVDVMIVYTPAAEEWALTWRTGIENVMALAVERGNITLADSQVDLRLRLVHAQRVDYTESGDAEIDLDRLTFSTDFDPWDLDPEGYMDEVHAWRNEYGADLVALLNVGNMGIAWLLSQVTGDPQFGFSVTPVQYADSIFIHEIGHNMGCHHSRNQVEAPAPPAGGLFEYSTGWRWTGTDNRGYCSIMTYPEGDTFVYLFSNPDISYAGTPTGSYQGTYAPADNARSIREIKSVVAGYRPTVVPDDDDDFEDPDDPESDVIWYVDNANQPDVEDGLSWETAFIDIQDAVVAAQSGHEIWVARGAGPYTGTGAAAVVTMKDDVRIYGGFVGDETERAERNPILNVTIIDGENARNAVIGASEAVLDGFTITRGKSQGDDIGGMRNIGVEGLIVRNCRFENNALAMHNSDAAVSVQKSRFRENANGMNNSLGGIEVLEAVFEDNTGFGMRNLGAAALVYSSIFSQNWGGAMINSDALPLITYCLFEDNEAPEGGALKNTNSNVQIMFSTFRHNRATDGSGGAIHGGNLTMRTVYLGENEATLNGGAIAAAGPASNIINCRFVRNRAGRQGGAMHIITDLDVVNALVYANHAQPEGGAGFANNGAEPRIWNSTFASNFGYALYNMSETSNTRVTNCIIWGNEGSIRDVDGNAPVVTFSNVQGGYDGEGNIDADPLFRNLAQGDMYLLEDSPCINTGTAEGAPDYDIVENERGAQPDMGAWEYVGEDGGDMGEGDDGTLPDEGEGEGEGEEEEEVDGADFNAESLVRDAHALLPLHDWVPLFRFTMSYDLENPAPRNLRRLVYRLVNDPDGDDRAYMVEEDLHVTDVLEFGLFEDVYNDDDEAGEPRYGNLSTDDFLVLSWDSFARPLGTVMGLTYDLDFTGRGIQAHPAIDDFKPDGNAYIVAVRTSATWRSQLSMGVELLLAEMVDPDTGVMPRDEDGELIDSYSPDFEDGDTLEADAYYSSSFGVYDPSGPDFAASPDPLISVFGNVPTPNFWQHTPYLSIPLAEFSRPHWNKPLQLMNLIGGEFMHIRHLLSLDDWTAVIGINLHSTRSLSTGDEEFAQIREVNIILTDVGADPYGPPGFNPNDALKPVIGGDASGPNFGNHVVHSGIWVWEDGNNNALFDPPTPLSIGVNFNGDLPLTGIPLTGWERITEPPGGGDPWWKITLGFACCPDVDVGWIDPVPNNVLPGDDVKIGSEFSYDFFVVARLDSGYRDCSVRPATNTGATMGSEFRAFIEPRRLDFRAGAYAGGILVESQIPAWTDPLSGVYWQNDPRWLMDEPWWPERTMNAAAAKPFKVGLEVYDMVHTYHSRYMGLIELFKLLPMPLVDLDLDLSALPMGFAPIGEPEGSMLGLWMDPFGMDRSRFQNFHYPDIYSFYSIAFALEGVIFGEPYRLLTGGIATPQFAFEVRPFFSEAEDLPPYGPRSGAYPTPPGRLSVPSYFTWPAQLDIGAYPAYSDWAPSDARARLLTQKIDLNSKHTPVLGFNMSGSADPVVNEDGNGVTVAEINVAFWGPDFSPDILKPIDPDKNDNRSLSSGVLLWENNPEAVGALALPVTFFNSQEVEYYGDTPLPMLHRVIPVTRAQWSGAPEYVDISGNGLPDDLNGDGIVDEQDKAWVLTLRPRNLWEAPQQDVPGTADGGLDMFVTVSTSDAISRFQKFRAVVPATLPSRAAGRRQAGIQFYPPVNTAPAAYAKAHGEEDPVVPYFGHDMLEANVPMKIVDMTQLWADIQIGGAPTPVLGLNISTNRENGTRAQGSNGVGTDRGLHVPGARWTPDMHRGNFLIDRRYESYEIVGNTRDTLELLSGAPRSGAWRIVESPTFLEEVTVEFYQEGAQASFNPLTDLLPLDIDQRVSGVAIYRDNDNHPDNRNGMFDPDIDIPLTLDAPPRFVGRTAEEIKVRFVFSTPGTSDFPRPQADQPRNRQWVHDSFGYRVSDPEYGPDFFIVLRGSNDMQVGDNFRVGIVSWGPNTPSEPDPHIWANLPGENRHDYLKFREFPWAERGAGFITYFKEPPVYYFLNGSRASQRPDSSGYNWLRSHSLQKRRSGVITARNRSIGPLSLVIDSVSQSRLPIQTLPGQGFSFIIYGNNFGVNPSVALSGYHVTVNSARNDAISVTISTRPEAAPQEPVTLVVRNPETGEEASRSDLFTLTSDYNVYGPRILNVNPARGRKEDFPVVVEGENFFGGSRLEVRFGETLMPILNVAPDGRAITVGFPVGGMPRTGMLDVFVTATGANSGQDVLKDGFEYINPEKRPKTSFFGCAPSGTERPRLSGDLALLGLASALLALVGRRQHSRA